MFSQFENMFKKQAQKITQSIPTNLLGQTTNKSNNDYSRTPQKFIINGRQIQQKKLLAEGAFGFIWVAEDIQTKQQFALKRVICMTEDKVKSALTQKSLLQKLPASPYIVKYYGGIVFKYDGNTVVVTLMQLCPGGNLFDLLQKRQGKGMPQQTVKTIASSVLQGLAVLHKAGFIHRDIKIENVLIGKDKKMKVCDFGSCTTEIVDFSQIPKSDYQNVKQNIQAFTTPMYRPPQIVDPYLKYKVSGKVDLWMLGCVLYTMSYFTHPFVQANAVGIANGVFRFPNYPSQTKYQVSTKMQDFIRNFLTPNPQFRPSPQKMLQILAKWDDLPSIPLNLQAKKLKKQHEQKQQQLKNLNKKVSSYEGDIPMQQLMKLQKKLQGKNQQNFQKQSVSFITNKEIQRLSQGGSVIIKKTVKQPQKNDQFFKVQQKTHSSIQYKKVPSTSISSSQSSSKNNDFWGNDFFNQPKPHSTITNSNNNNNFADFNQIFNNPQQTIKQTNSSPNKQNKNVNNNNDLLQFFSQPIQQTQQNKDNKSSKPVQQVNLLDL